MIHGDWMEEREKKKTCIHGQNHTHGETQKCTLPHRLTGWQTEGSWRGKLFNMQSSPLGGGGSWVAVGWSAVTHTWAGTYQNAAGGSNKSPI